MGTSVEILSKIVGVVSAEFYEGMHPVYRTLLFNYLTLKSTEPLFKKYGDAFKAENLDAFNDKNPKDFIAEILGNVEEIFTLMSKAEESDDTVDIYLILLDIIRILEQRSCHFSSNIYEIKASVEAIIERQYDALSFKKIENIFDELSSEPGVSKTELLLAHKNIILSSLASLLSNPNPEISFFELRYFWLKNKLPIVAVYPVLNGNQSINIIAQNAFFSANKFQFNLGDSYLWKMDIVEGVAEEATLSEDCLSLIRRCDFKIPIFLLGKMNLMQPEEAEFLAKSWHKFITTLAQKDTALSREIYISCQEPIGQLIEVMGADAFVFLEKYMVESVVVLKEILQKMPKASDDALSVVKMYFSQYKKEILADGDFYKVFEKVFIFCSKLNVSIARVINPLSPEDKVIFLNQLTKFVESIQKIDNDKISSLSNFYIDGTRQFFIGKIIEIMGADAFLFLEKYLEKDPGALERIFQVMPSVSENFVRMMQKYFNRNRDNILNNVEFYQSWENILIISSKLGVSLTNVVGAFDEEKTMAFFDEYTKFIELLISIDGGKAIKNADDVRFYLNDSNKHFMATTIEIMGIDAFIFLEKFIEKNTSSLEKIFKITSASNIFIHRMKKYFNLYKEQILGKESFLKFFEKTLVNVSQINSHDLDVVRSFSPSERDAFFESQDQFMMNLFKAYGAECADNRIYSVRLDDFYRNFKASIEYCLKIMGADVFLFFSKYLAERGVLALGEFFNAMPLWQAEDNINILKLWFLGHKNQALEEKRFFKVFAEILIDTKNVRFSFINSSGSLSSEEKTVFLASQEKFVQNLIDIYQDKDSEVTSFFEKNSDTIKTLVKIMGADAFLFMENYLLKEIDVIALEKILGEMPRWISENGIIIIKLWFLSQKHQLLEEREFFKTFAKNLFEMGNCRLSFVDSSESLSPEEKVIFLVNQEQFVQHLVVIYQDNGDAFTNFFKKNARAIGSLTRIMGADAFLFMEQSLLRKDIVALEKMLNLIPLSVSKVLAHTGWVWLSQFKDQAFGDVNFFEVWENVLTNLGERKDFYITPKELMLSKGKKKFFEKHDRFMKLFFKVNQQMLGHETQYRDPEEFFMKHGRTIRKLIDIMGEDAFTFFEKYIAKTVLSLERMLENLSTISNEQLHDMQMLFNHHKKSVFNGSVYKDWENALMTIMLVFNISNNKTLVGISNLIKPEEESLAQLNLRLVQDLIKATFFSLQFSEQELATINFDELSSLIPTQDFPKLVLAQQKMDKDQYYKIFIEILKSYVLKKSIEDVVHRPPGKVEPEKDSNIERLKQHNENITKELVKAGVSTDFANRNETFSFVYEKANDGSSRVLSILRALWSHVMQVKDQLDLLKKSIVGQENVNGSSSEERLLQLDKMLQEILGLEKVFSENEHLLEKDKYLLLLSEGNKKSLNDLIGNIDSLNEDKSASLPASFLEHAEHFKKAYEDLLSLKEKDFKNTEKEVKPVKFIIKHWDKNNITSLFLGSPVRCCLAPDGAQFPALIQRLMDDAMFFHVVTEEGSAVPVALSWLYFATDSAKPDEVYVMANFLEISPKYGSDEDAKKVIINALLHYTQQFSKDIGAAGFLINHLTYGWISDFKCFDQQAMTPKKVGGCLNLEGSLTDSSSRYYLNSLHAKSFHVYDLAKISPEDRARFLTSTSPSKAPLIANKVISNASFFSKATPGCQSENSKSIRAGRS